MSLNSLLYILDDSDLSLQIMLYILEMMKGCIVRNLLMVQTQMEAKLIISISKWNTFCLTY